MILGNTKYGLHHRLAAAVLASCCALLLPAAVAAADPSGADGGVAAPEASPTVIEWEVIAPHDGLYVFTAPVRAGDEGLWLWIDDAVAIDGAPDPRHGGYRGEYELEAGRRYRMRLQGYGRPDPGDWKLHWSAPQLSRQPLPMAGARAAPMLAVAATPSAAEVRPTVAHIYYVATTGSNGNPGSLDRPFRTIQKCASVAVAGDTCSIRGGTYRESVRPARSGAAGAPVRFQAYGGETVTVSGADTVGGWSLHNGNIYVANKALRIKDFADTGFLANQVFVGGAMQPQARWPNNRGTNLLKPGLEGGFVRPIDGHRYKVEVVNAGIPSLPEGWAGATLWANEWYTSRTGTVTGGGAGRLTATMSAPYWRSGYWFFLVGKLGLLDAPGEWHYDHGAKKLYLWAPGGGRPSGVEVKMRNLAFDLRDRSYIDLRNLNLFAATVTTSDASRSIVLDGLRVKYVSHHVTLPPLPKSEHVPGTDNARVLSSHAHDTGIQLRGRDHVLRNSEIAYSSGNGVLLEGSSHLVRNNVIRVGNYASTYAALIRANGSGHRILRNTLSGAGRSAIDVDWRTNGFRFQDNEIAYNRITRFGALSSDLGGIYICCNVDLAGTRIHHNRIYNPYRYSYHWDVAGIYTDSGSHNVTVHHNLLHAFNVNKANALKISTKASKGPERIYNNTVDAWMRVPTTDNHWVRNNIFVRSRTATGKSVSHNLFQGSNPRFVDAANGDYRLRRGSPAIDSGRVLSHYTNGYKGANPDRGAFESRVRAWTAGATLPAR